MIHGSANLTGTSELLYSPAIQAFARELSREIGFDRSDEEKILIAIEEAVINVIKHAFESTEQSFQICFEPSPTGIGIITKDMGLLYDPGLIPEYEAPKDMEEMPSKGLGSFIMRKCVDEVLFCNLGKGVKELHLVFYVSKARRRQRPFMLAEQDPGRAASSRMRGKIERTNPRTAITNKPLS